MVGSSLMDLGAGLYCDVGGPSSIEDLGPASMAKKDLDPSEVKEDLQARARPSAQLDEKMSEVVIT